MDILYLLLLCSSYLQLLHSLPLLQSSTDAVNATLPTGETGKNIHEYRRLFDALSTIVDRDYSTSVITHADEDEVSIDAEKDNSTRSIAEINRNASLKIPLFQGDMRLSLTALQSIVDGNLDGSFFEDSVDGSGEGSGEDEQRRSKREAIRGQDVRWNDGVPYAFHPLLGVKARNVIMEAMQIWTRETCISFRPKLFEANYLYFAASEGCWSTVGRDSSVQQQWISIGEGCEELGIVSHEIGHALGLFHEQSRFDRDNHVIVDILRVKAGYSFQFSKVPSTQMTTHSLPYDVGSIMHYAPNEFAELPNVPALRAKDPYLQASMGQLGGPSFIDIAMLNRQYECQAKCIEKIQCSNYGYQDPRDCSRCKCPPGFGGVDCRDVEESNVKCGGLLNATDGMRQLRIVIKQNTLRTSERRCVYQIVAPVDMKFVEVVVMHVEATCMYGCWKEGVEVKAREDTRPLGYRFCCPSQVGTHVISDRRRVPIIVFSRGGQTNVIINYRYEPISPLIVETSPAPVTSTDSTPNSTSLLSNMLADTDRLWSMILGGTGKLTKDVWRNFWKRENASRGGDEDAVLVY